MVLDEKRKYRKTYITLRLRWQPSKMACSQRLALLVQRTLTFTSAKIAYAPEYGPTAEVGGQFAAAIKQIALNPAARRDPEFHSRLGFLEGGIGEWSERKLPLRHKVSPPLGGLDLLDHLA